MWREMVARGRAAARVVGAGRYLELRYEELCREPDRTGASLAAFLGTAPDRRFRKRIRGARTRSIGVHRRQSAEMIRRAGEVGSPLLGELGYQT
jgi:hypothetical protein